jgi:DNA-binding transcriptional LysR family regulator
MDLIRNMRTFAQVAEESSFSSAARSLNISTGAVSRLISELEQHLATRLLHRTTRQMALTQAGRVYLVRCRAVLEAISEAEAEARSVHLEPAGSLKVHASPSLGRHYLIPAVKEYTRTHPSVHVSLTLSEPSSHSLEEGFDTAILAIPALRDSSLVGVQLGETYSVLCAAPSYLQACVAPEVPAALAQLSFISNASALTHALELELKGPQGSEWVSVRPSLCVNSFASVASALEIGMGIGALPLHDAAESLRAGRLVRVLPQYQLEHLNIYALFASKLFLDAKVRTWLDHLKTFFPKSRNRRNITDSEQLACAL